LLSDTVLPVFSYI